MHAWTRVEPGIYHAFHHEWISEISRALNRGLLPANYYSLHEQQAAGFGPEVLTFQDLAATANAGGTASLTRVRPASTHHAVTPAEFHRRKRSSIPVRHVSGVA